MSILKQIIRGMDPSIRRRNSSEAYSKNINLANPQSSTNLQQIASTDIKAISVNNLIDSILKELGSLMMSSVRHKNVSGQKLDTVFPFENGAVSGSLVQSKSMRTTLNQQLVLLAAAVESSQSVNQKDVDLVKQLMNNLIETNSKSDVDLANYLKNMYEFLSVIKSLTALSSPVFLRAVKSILDDIFRLLVSYKVDGFGHGSRIFSFSEKPNELSMLREPIIEPSYLKLLSGNAGMPKIADKSFVELLSKISDLIGSTKGMEYRSIEKAAILLKMGTTRPLTGRELQIVANLFGVDREAKLAKFISHNSLPAKLNYPMMRRLLFNNISSQLTELSSGDLSPDLYRKIDSGMELFHNLFRAEKIVSTDSNIKSSYSIIQKLFYSRLTQGLSSHGIEPTSLRIIGSQVLLENSREVTKESLNSMFNSSAPIINNIKIRNNLKPHLNASMLLKRLELPQTFINARYIIEVLKVHAQLSKAFVQVDPIQQTLAPSSLSGLRRLSDLSAGITAFINGKNGDYKNLIEFSLAMGVKIPPKLVRLGVRSSNSPESLSDEINTEIENSYQQVKTGTVAAGMIKNLIGLRKISDQFIMNVPGLSPPESGKSEDIITKLGITKNKIEEKIGMRLILMDMDLSSGSVNKVSKFLLETLGIKESKITVPDIDRILRMVRSDLPLNQKVWNELRTFDILSPENEQLILNYLNLLNSSASVNKSDDGLRQLLELLLSLSSDVGKKDSLKIARSLLSRTDKILNSFQLKQTADKLDTYIGKTLKSELMTLEAQLKSTLSTNRKDQIKSLFNSLAAVFEGIHTLQANNSNQSDEFFFAFPFPHSSADAQAFCHYFEDQTPEGEDQMNIKLTLSPEPIGTVEVSILKSEKRIDVTFNLERQQYRELFLENIEEFGEKLKSVGHQLIKIHCSKLIKKETEELNLPGLYA